MSVAVKSNECLHRREAKCLANNTAVQQMQEWDETRENYYEAQNKEDRALYRKKFLEQKNRPR